MPSPASRAVSCAFVGALVSFCAVAAQTRQGSAPSSGAPAAAYRALLDEYCVGCHNSRLLTANLDLEKGKVDPGDPGNIVSRAETWEKVLHKLDTGAMPPPGKPRPDAETSRRFAGWLEGELDRAAARAPNPGRPTAHRLNRAEYTNAIRDLLDLQIDARALLPADDLSFGFDNNADILGVSPGLLERYLSAARKVARVAVGDARIRPTIEVFNVSPLLVQDDRMSEDLPFGSRGGAAFQHYFPLDAEYVFRLRLQKDNTYVIRGLTAAEPIDLRIDGERVKQFTVGGPQMKRSAAEAELEVRLPLKAGLHLVSASFPSRRVAASGLGPERLPVGNFLPTGTVRGAGVRELTAIAALHIDGPYAGRTPADSPSRRAIFTCRPAAPAPEDDDEKCARSILTRLARRAYRRPATNTDVDTLLAFYREGREDGGFEAGVQEALTRLLVDPEFLFRVERDPPKANAGAAYRISDVELASRLSFFLWSSIPDEELLDAASSGRLRNRTVLEQQVKRMLADRRASTMVTNFASQWLQLRNMSAVAPDVNLFPEFDDNLRLAMQQETELFVESQIRDDRGVGDLLTADYTFLNERLARHYGVPNVIGSHFRRVLLGGARQGGLLGHGSILTQTSHATRTSPVLRGKWVLENVLGAPPPPPPPTVPPLPEKDEASDAKSVRARLELHRNNPACSACHARMDPLGFALESFDAVGKVRSREQDGSPIDTATVLPDGTAFDGPSGLRALLAARDKALASTIVSKMTTYALGRGVEHYDLPAIRAIVRDAEPGGYRWSSLVLGIVRSVPFQMRRAE
jgi:mono/diheme cytochrome c family protein